MKKSITPPTKHSSRTKRKGDFVKGLFKVLESGRFNTLICWGEDGTYFKVLDPKQFAETVLPHFCKHTNIDSFIRQLHIYQFHKIYREFHECKMCYMHPSFQKGQPELLDNVKRVQKCDNSTNSSAETPERASRKKRIKISTTESAISDHEAGDGYFTGITEADAAQMEKCALFILEKYCPIFRQNTMQKVESENFFQLFSLFRNDVYKLLEFDKIDQELI